MCIVLVMSNQHCVMKVLCMVALRHSGVLQCHYKTVQSSIKCLAVGGFVASRWFAMLM